MGAKILPEFKSAISNEPLYIRFGSGLICPLPPIPSFCIIGSSAANKP